MPRPRTDGRSIRSHPAQKSWDGLASSPAEHVPLDSGLEGLPVRGYCLAAVKSGAPPLDFTTPRIINAFLFGFVQTLEKASGDLSTVVLGQFEHLLKQRGSSVSHDRSLAQPKDACGFPPD